MRWLAVIAFVIAFKPSRADACGGGGGGGGGGGSSPSYDQLLAPAIAPTREGTVFTWWHRTDDPLIEGARVFPHRDPNAVDFAASADGEPDIAAGDHGALVVWSRQGQVYSALLVGIELGEPVLLGSGDQPHVSWDGSRYHVAWPTYSRVMAASLDRDGHVEQTMTLAITSAWGGLDIASLGATTLVVWSNYTGSGTSIKVDLVGMRVGVDATPLQISAEQDWEKVPTVAAGRSQFLVGWLRYDQVEFKRVDTDGTVVDALPLASWPTEASTRPCIASSGGRWIAIWNQWGHLVRAMIGGETDVSTVASGVASGCDIAWDGERYAVAYVHDRPSDGNTYESDIYALWLDKEGNVVEPETPIATDHGCACDAQRAPDASSLLLIIGLAICSRSRRRAAAFHIFESTDRARSHPIESRGRIHGPLHDDLG